MVWLVIAAAVVLATVQASFFEWAFHKYWLHKPWLPADCFRAHTLVHHQLCKFEDTFQVVEKEQEEALTFTWWGGPALVGINLVPWVLLGWALHAGGLAIHAVAFLVAFGVVVALYYAGYEGFHYLMHRPTFPRLENTRVFQFLKRHHVIHHVQMDRNLNVLLPLADFCFRTLVLEKAVAAPQVTSPAALRTARRYSRRRSDRMSEY